jgi:hypothetical protein
MLTLDHLSKNRPEIDRARIAGAAMAIAQDENAPEPSRITAVAMCGRHDVVAARETLRKLARSDERRQLKLAAVAALGRTGDAGDLREFRGQMEKGAEAWTVPALRLAVGMLEERIQQGR